MWVFILVIAAFLAVIVFQKRRVYSVAPAGVAVGAAVMLAFVLLSGGGDHLRNGTMVSQEYSQEPGYQVTDLGPSADGTTSLEGYVRDRHSGEALPNAHVQVLRYRHPDFQPSVAAVTDLSALQAVRARSSDAPIGSSQLEVLTTDDSGYYRIEVADAEVVELQTFAFGYWDQDTPNLLAEGRQQVDIYPATLDQPAPLPASEASYVIDEGFAGATASAPSASETDALKEQAASGLRCQGIDVQASDITNIEEIPHFTEIVKTNVLLRSDDCNSVEARTVDYSGSPTDAKVISVKGKDNKFTLLDDCVNLTIPTPKEGRLKIIKWEDKDGDGKPEKGEGPPSADVTFTFHIKGPDFDKTVTTDVNGLFVSDALPPGTYTVKEINIPDGWEATTATTQTVEVKDGDVAPVEFGNRKVTPPPPPVTIVGKKVWVHGEKHRVPNEVFTFELSVPGLPTLKVKTDPETGEFRFEDVDIFTGPNTDAEQVTVKIREIAPSDKWQPIDPASGEKTLTIKRGEKFKDAGVWKNRTVKPPGPEPTPTPKPSPTATPKPSPTPTPKKCEVTILGPHRVDNTQTHARMQASIQWDRLPNFDHQIEWWLNGDFIGSGEAVQFMIPLNEENDLGVYILDGSETICYDEVLDFAEGSVPPGEDIPGTDPLPTETPIPQAPPDTDPDDGYGGPA
ncbi:MAG: prealbumin-like fold domain-containing protein [Candidatus Woykebacteria bacterium]